MGTPIAILLTLFGSVKKPYSRKRKILTIIATGLLSIFSFFYIMGSMCGRRVVEVKPFLLLFWKANPVDTVTIDKTQWIRIDKEGDVKFP
jgi:hypothetical protein